ncbi:MAG: hypothetical protein R2932_56255 [Caldilineaceae bacterium]
MEYKPLVRIIRFVVLFVAIITLFLTTPTYELRPFASLLSPDLVADWPLLSSLVRWVVEDRANIALLLTSCAALTFGVLAIPWPFPTSADPHTVAESSRSAAKRLHRSRLVLGWGLLLAALAGAMMLMLMQLQILQLQIMQPLPQALIWVVALGFFLAAAGILTGTPPRSQALAATATSHTTPTIPVDAQPLRPGTRWPMTILILFLGLLLYGWHLFTVPATIDPELAQLGLHALEMSQGPSPSLFAPIPTLSQPDNHLLVGAIATTALVSWLTGDLLRSVRLVGIIAAVLTLFAVWLVGGELFARRRDPRNALVPIEDNGQVPALLATVLLAVNMAIFYFSRQPVLLEATAWGTLGCWAMLRGIRTHDRLALGLGGLLCGLSYLFDNTGLTFLLTGLLWWCGFAAVRLGWLVHRSDSQRLTYLGLGDFLLWVLGFCRHRCSHPPCTWR